MSAGGYIRSGELWHRRVAEAIDITRVLYAGTSTSFGDVYTITLELPLSEILTGQVIIWTANSANSSTASLVINNSRGDTIKSTTTIKRSNGSTNLGSLEIPGGPVITMFDGTNHRLLLSNFGGALTGDDEAFGSGWDGDNTFPTKNAIYDYFSSGSYTPTWTGTANVTSVTAAETYYIKTGTTVMVTGSVEINPTVAAGTLTTLVCTLPITSSLSNLSDLSGVINALGVAGMQGGIAADAVGDRANIFFRSPTTGGTGMAFHFAYKIV
jgi:hypothetical protein